MEDKFINALHEYTRQQRQARFLSTAQSTLGELINAIENAGTVSERTNETKSVCFAFGTAIPNGLDSWRGSYNELAIGYKLWETSDASYDACKADKFLAELKEAVGKEYTGYKGGEFVMSADTPLWVANYGHSGNTGVIGIKDNGYEIVILTAYCEY